MEAQREERYSILAPLSVELQKQITIDLLRFFSPLNNGRIRSELSLQALPAIQPLSVGQFFEWARKASTRSNYDRLWHHIIAIIKRMTQCGLLSSEGRARAGVLGDGDLFYAGAERSKGASRGSLFIGRALGSSYIAQEIQKALVAISGITKAGDIAIGTGVHIHQEYVVTCDHVIRDMTVDSTLIVNGAAVSVVKCLLNDTLGIDVGVIRFKPAVPVGLNDLLFRDANLLEEVLVAGFPTVPTTIDRVATFQRGEISQTSVPTMWKYNVDLFSAIARPGNSGGPLVTSEGNIVGLVTQSLEREQEAADPMRMFPFFAAVPASDVRKEFEKLTGEELPWETYQ
jgi:hypothetical protein